MPNTLTSLALTSLGMLLACGGFGGGNTQPEATATSSSSSSQSLPMLQPQERDGSCVLMDLETGAALVSVPGECFGGWTYSRARGGSLMVNLYQDRLALGSDKGLAPIAMPELPEGQSLDGVGYASDDRLVMLVGENLDVKLNDAKQTAHATLEGKRVVLDYDMASMFGVEGCRMYVYDGKQFVRQGEAWTVQLFEGRSTPFCDVPDAPVHLNMVSVGGESPDIPEYKYIEAPGAELSALYGPDDMMYWVEYPAQGLASLAYDFEGMRLSTPLAHKEGGAWKGVPGMQEEGGLSLYMHGDKTLACGGEGAALFGPGGALLWSGEGSCPAFK